MVSILFDLKSSRTISTACYLHITVEKKFRWNCPQKVSKLAPCCADFQKNSCVKQKGENIYRKKYRFFRDFKNLAKKRFFGKNLWAFLDVRVWYLFEISAKLCFFCYPLQTISKNFFHLLKRAVLLFSRIKGKIR